MEVFPISVLILAGLFSVYFMSGNVDAICSPNCLEDPANETGLACNEAAQECLYGCQDGYGGERCQFQCASNCSNCTIIEYECDGNCTGACENNTCYNETCIQGCAVGFYGENCSIPCSAHCLNSTCARENGTCLLGCEEEHFGNMCENNVADADCNPTCLAAPETNPGYACNETTLECLYGCQQGYAGERCQYRCDETCLNCTTENCTGDCNVTCDNSTCYQNETCLQGCLNGFYSQNCSLPCPEHCLNSTCGRENGTCLLGCEGDFFGDTCETTCSPNCKDGSGNETRVNCNVTTLNCLYGCKGNFEGAQCDTCKRGWTGPNCTVECDYNCLDCKPDGGCNRCYPNYYIQNRDCILCRPGCYRNASTNYGNCKMLDGGCIPACDQVDGECTLGCIPEWYDRQCHNQCGALCSPRICGRNDGCCTEGCKYQNKGGCDCKDPCSSNCVNNTCYQNKTCMEGCELNHWGPDCNQECSGGCAQGLDNSTFVCDNNGNCVFGCKKTFMGPQCLGNCSTNCKEKDCNETSGHCLQGCVKGYSDNQCNASCSLNCLEADCHQISRNCSQGCVTGFYGPLCSVDCPLNCLNSTCLRGNGTCSFGCKEGFTGPQCDVEIIAPPLPDKTDVTVVAATAGGAGAGFIALIVVAVILRFRYVAYKEAACVKEKHRITVVEQNKLKNKRKEFAMALVNPAFETEPTKLDGKYKEEEDGVRKVEELMDFVIKTDMDGFDQEFQMLPANVTKPEKQKRKNTYKPGGRKVKFSDDESAFVNPSYGETDVQIDNVFIENENNLQAERTYNASNIEVYSRKYIAAEGPDYSTSLDFWLLIWKTSCPVVVMMTPTSIHKQTSSVRYWPEHGKADIYGSITITSLREDTFANHVLRELKMERNGETRNIYQLQLLLWPDAKKFPSIADLMEFYMHFRAISDNTTEPVLVHCSDGEGRTGIFIALDLLVRDGERFWKINVIDCVKTLREQRDNMVQTKEQYKFVYTIVAQTLQMRCKVVAENYFVDAHQQSQRSLESNPLISHIEDSYENMRAAIVVMKPVDEESIKRQWNLKKKNREDADIPEDPYRPVLPGGGYINAVYIDGLRKKDMIMTQMPMPKTTNDFCSLVTAEKCHVIVMMNSLDTKEKSVGIYWPMKEGKAMAHGNICVNLEESTKTDDYKLKTLTFWDRSRKGCCKNDMPEEEEHEVSFFQFTNWESGSRPSDTSSILRLIQAVKNKRGQYDPSPVLVHCLNGSEKSGVFCALYELTEAIERGLEISVVNTAYKIKYRRPNAILNLNQFKFIHEALETFITSEEFRGEPVESEVPQIIADDDD